MALTTQESNFFRLTYIIVNVLTKHLRTLFIKEWNNKFETWSSDNKSGDRIWELLGESFRKANRGWMKKIQTGNEKQWDITILCKIFLYSDLKLKDTSKYTEIDNIRRIRNNYFAHPENVSCSDDEFIATVAEIKSAAKILFEGDLEREISGIEKSAIDQIVLEQSRIGKRLVTIALFYAFIEVEVFNI